MDPEHRRRCLCLVVESLAPSTHSLRLLCRRLYTFLKSTFTPLLPPSFLLATYFGSSKSVAKMDLSQSTLRLMARGIDRTRPQPAFALASLGSGVFLTEPGLQSWTHHHCNSTLCLPVHTGLTPFPAKRRWQYRRNFGRLVDINPIITLRRLKLSRGSRVSRTDI
jgi:hypothetical protein